MIALDDLDYELPPELIAQVPIEPRDAARLLVYERAAGRISDRVFAELPALLRPGDVLVRNDTRVFAARSFFRRASGGRIEVLFLRPAPGDGDGEAWEALLRGRPRRGEVLTCDGGAVDWQLRCDEPFGDGRWRVTSLGARPVLELLETAGATPLPPYIRTPLADAERYQTSYARVVGSAAAPTAGLHFTPALDDALRAADVTIETVTLHVGLGTFKPLQAETLQAATLHSETYEVDPAVWACLLAARAQGRRVIAVGTTSMRTLEHLAALEEAEAGAPQAGVRAAAPVGAADAAATPAAPVGGSDAGARSAAPADFGRAAGTLGWTDAVRPAAPPLRGETALFISPGYPVRLVDGLITNFHLPRTSLLALVMAVCGVAETRALYQHAVAARYRFYSFGDAMLVL